MQAATMIKEPNYAMLMSIIIKAKTLSVRFGLIHSALHYYTEAWDRFVPTDFIPMLQSHTTFDCLYRYSPVQCHTLHTLPHVSLCFLLPWSISWRLVGLGSIVGRNLDNTVINVLFLLNRSIKHTVTQYNFCHPQPALSTLQQVDISILQR